ncbi:hypothetical protein WN944_015139 [Citrus x changshan-huyou]|uniref:UPF3 domain-containing protein n=1 Tax=Citrus x changshan-huyou TaxID=2935761 RepID=A0AAP0MBX7_9ROSI
MKKPADVFEFAELLNGHLFVNEKGAQFKAVVEYAPSQRVPKPCSRNDSREGTIFKDSDYLEFLKVIAKPAENLPSSEIQHLMGDSLSSLTVKELKQLENRLERGITRFRFKKEIELENESVCLRSKVCKSVRSEMERFQQANTVTGQELNAIHALASRNFFSPAIIEGGGTAYSHPDKKILYLG